MTVYVLRNGRLVPKAKVSPPEGPFVLGDLPAYTSPVTGAVIEGRTARRDDLRRHNCREVDPSEYKAGVCK